MPLKTHVRRLLKALGPGLITGASDDDPSGIGTYAIAGASLGYTTLWTALVTTPMMAAVQFVCAKVGMVSGLGLSGILRRHYPRAVLYPAVGGLVIANTLNVGVDIGAIAAGIDLLVPIPISYLIAPIALLILALLTFGSYGFIERTFKWLTLTLLAYIGASFLARPDWSQVLAGTFLALPSPTTAYLSTLVAILGTTVSPYLFFWQANMEVEEEIARGRRRLRQRQGASRSELKYAAWDVDIGMILSNIVMYFIILATAATLFEAGRTDIASAAEAAEALRPLAGDAAGTLFALGLIGTGFLAVPILAGSASYALSESFGWRYGLDEKPRHAKRFYAVIAISMLLGMLVNFLGLNPIQALFWMAVINGFLAGPLLVLIMLVANNREVMGNRVNGLATNVMGWMTALVMFAAAGGMILTWLLS
ncbi:MAG: Nramp family divalent metal transporter [Chloroflexi bacterium]|nr:Nramp family divalent metal transporter [Chloroflexota bacterium]